MVGGSDIDENDLAQLAAVARNYPAHRPIERVGIGPRLLAALIDAIVLFVVMLVFFILVAATTELLMSNRSPSLGGVIALVVVPPFTYFLAEMIWGATLGKRVMDIRIARADGGRANMTMLALRWGYKYGATAALVGYGILWITLLYDSLWGEHVFQWLLLLMGVNLVGALAMLGPGRRALHDYLAGTAVYREEDVRATQLRLKAFEVMIPEARLDPTAPPPPPEPPFAVRDEVPDEAVDLEEGAGSPKDETRMTNQ